MTLNDNQLQLLSFVRNSHGDQKRKYTGEDYWTHPLAVAAILSDKIEDPGLLIEVAFCHDLFEDTPVTREVLSAELKRIGYKSMDRIFILNGVTALTDQFTTVTHPKSNRGVRKDWEKHRLAKIGAPYQTVKYADLIHNTSSIVEHDKHFSKIYLREKREILELMRMGNLEMFIYCYTSLIEAEDEYKQRYK